MKKSTVLIIDDEKNMRHLLKMILEKEGYETSLAPDGQTALRILEEHHFDIILCDIRMPVMDGIGFLKKIQDKSIPSVIITMSAYGTIDLAIETMKLGAYDYISKPFKPDEVILTLKKAQERERLRKENISLKQELQKKYNFSNLIGKSPHMLHLFNTITKISAHKSSVLITGESGTGKELVAKAIHYNSPRKNQTFLAVNCGAIPESLLESELFGHKKGAFTGAMHNRKGIFEEADGGSILLDEIGDLPSNLQVKLLRVLQEREIKRIGEERPVSVDVRIITATAKDLAREVHKGTFREDLFYRLNVLPLHLPPLRDRKEDIPLLVEHFIEKYNESLGLHIEGITPRALKMMVHYHWPGNIRELENVIERAMVLTEKTKIDVDDISSMLKNAHSTQLDNIPKNEYSIKKMEKLLEKTLIKKAITKANGNKTHAARLLEISYPSLLSKLDEYQIQIGNDD